jgi:hypothetical protein
MKGEEWDGTHLTKKNGLESGKLPPAIMPRLAARRSTRPSAAHGFVVGKTN